MGVRNCEGEPVCACGPLCTQARGGATLQDDASLLLCHWMPPTSPKNLSPHDALHHRRRQGCGSFPVTGSLSSQSPPGAWHRESVSTWRREAWGGLPGVDALAAGNLGQSPLGSAAPRRVGVSPRPQGCNALRPHQAEPHVRLQTHFSGFCFREPTSQSLVARPEGEVLASRLPGRLWTRG